MLERPEKNTHLMEDLFESEISALLEENVQMQQESSRVIMRGHQIAPGEIELRLIPDFMKDTKGKLIITASDQRIHAEEVLNGLHGAWGGTSAFEHKFSDEYSENYWEFVDEDNGFTPWVVVERHFHNPGTSKISVSAYIVPGTTRPAEYQAIKNKKEEQLSMLEAEPRWLDDSQSTTTDQNSVSENNRRKRAAKSISKWVSKQTNLPPRPNRFE